MTTTDPDSIKIVKGTLSDEKRHELWLRHVSPSITSLPEEQLRNLRSLGIVCPDTGTIEFLVEKADVNDTEAQAIDKNIGFQQSLLSTATTPLKPLAPTPFDFKYRFLSGGKQHTMKIHDWEVKAAYYRYRRRYGDDGALEHLKEMYGKTIPSQNMHFIMGTIHKRPNQFIIVGILRTTVNLSNIKAQGSLL